MFDAHTNNIHIYSKQNQYPLSIFQILQMKRPHGKQVIQRPYSCLRSGHLDAFNFQIDHIRVHRTVQYPRNPSLSKVLQDHFEDVFSATETKKYIYLMHFSEFSNPSMSVQKYNTILLRPQKGAENFVAWFIVHHVLQNSKLVRKHFVYDLSWHYYHSIRNDAKPRVTDRVQRFLLLPVFNVWCSLLCRPWQQLNLVAETSARS